MGVGLGRGGGLDVPPLREGADNERGWTDMLTVPVPGNVDVTYQAEDCDVCSGPLTRREQLAGLCGVCEEARKAPKKRRETVKPSKGIL